MTRAIVRHESKALISAINREHQRVEEAGRGMLAHAMRCGQMLVEAKDSLPHGRWAAWLGDNFVASERTAQLYMQLAREGASRKSDLEGTESIVGALRSISSRRQPSLPPARPKVDPDSPTGKMFAAADKGLGAEVFIDSTAVEEGPRGLPARKWGLAVDHVRDTQTRMNEAAQEGLSVGAVASALNEAFQAARFAAIDLEQLSAAAARQCQP